MALSECPMCEKPLMEIGPETKSCVHCGADLTRWLPKAPKPPVLDAVETEAPREDDGQFNMTMGVTGAVGGAVIGVALMFGFFELMGFRFPLLGVGIGLLSGFGARKLYKGTSHTLGVISAVVAAISVVGALFLMYGGFPIVSIISVIVSVSVAYKLAGG